MRWRGQRWVGSFCAPSNPLGIVTAFHCLAGRVLSAVGNCPSTCTALSTVRTTATCCHNTRNNTADFQIWNLIFQSILSLNYRQSCKIELTTLCCRTLNVKVAPITCYYRSVCGCLTGVALVTPLLLSLVHFLITPSKCWRKSLCVFYIFRRC